MAKDDTAEIAARKRVQASKLSYAEQADPLGLRHGRRKRGTPNLGEPVLERSGKAAEGWDKTDLAAGGGRVRSQQKLPSMSPDRRGELIAEIQDQYGVDLDREQVSELLVRRMTQLDRALTEGEHRSLHWYLLVNQRRARGKHKTSSYGDPIQSSGDRSIPITDRALRDADCLDYVRERLPLAYQQLLDVLTWMQYPESYSWAEVPPPEARELGCQLIVSRDKRAGNAAFAGYFRAVAQSIGEAMLEWGVRWERRRRERDDVEERARKRRALGIED